MTKVVIKLKKGTYLFILHAPAEVWCVQSDLNHMNKKDRTILDSSHVGNYTKTSKSSQHHSFG